MKPPARLRRKRVISGIEGREELNAGKWTLNEKQRLLDGLKNYGSHKLENIQQDFLPQRSMTDLRYYIKSLKQKYKHHTNKKRTIPVMQAPIEMWMQEAQYLTQKEQDYSYSLADVFTTFGNLEPHDMLPHGHAPNWSEIYMYISALLRGTQPLEASPSNAMILLDMIDSLAEDLRAMDTTKQRLLMQLKAQLLETTTNASNRMFAYDRIHKALEKDPLAPASSQSQATTPRAPGTPTTQLPGQNTNTPNHNASSTNQSTPTAIPVTPDGTVQTSADSQASANQNSRATPSAHQSAQAAPSANQNAQAAPSANQSAQAASSANQSAQAAPSANQNTQSSSSANQSARAASTVSQSSGSRSTRSLKTPLFTLNPFYIPVKYLKMSPAQPQV